MSLKGYSESSDTSKLSEMSQSLEALAPSKPSEVNLFLRPEDALEEAEANEALSTKDRGPGSPATFPEGFHPRRSSQGPIHMPLYSAPIVKNPFMSPLLAPDHMLKTLPPVHIVVSVERGTARWDSRGWRRELGGGGVKSKGFDEGRKASQAGVRRLGKGQGA